MASSSGSMDIHTKEVDGQTYLIGPNGEEVLFEYDVNQIPEHFREYYRAQATLRSAGAVARPMVDRGVVTDIQGLTGAPPVHDEDTDSDSSLESDEDLESDDGLDGDDLDGDDLAGDGDPNGHAYAVSAAAAAADVAAPAAPAAPVAPVAVPAGGAAGPAGPAPVALVVPAPVPAVAAPAPVPVVAVAVPAPAAVVAPPLGNLAQLRAIPAPVMPWSCPVCGSGTPLWQRHLASHVTACGWPGCGLVGFANLREVALHINAAHGQGSWFQCGNNNLFSRVDSYYLHVGRHCIFG
ncbi:uncharacterized protein F4817DRAFT_311402 [Daldinia loculata]|uniref:uncharacterized protein n=1 Tax=Daldinia loculata TaxID=103429 RepID=UPI0020C5B13A|nr:uncharacterized protein F4817DRAFT_311402 [Daldinia loculata]KAI1651796.1 hypothetical protein F4817DRAFT_311402 [Daldinia loculata]